MGERSKIEWTDHTFNPWMGCTKVSEACKHCYAETFTGRYNLASWGDKAERQRTSVANWKKPISWSVKAFKEQLPPPRVFCASLADVAEVHPSITTEWRQDLYNLIIKTYNMDWLLLTKRPENLYLLNNPEDPELNYRFPTNVWLGTTTETQRRYKERMPELMKYETPVRFISCEPMFTKITLDPNMLPDWVIIGGESGHLKDCRKLDLNHVRDLIEQCDKYNIKVFVKQLGRKAARDMKLKSWVGADFDEYPALLDWLMRREIPDYFLAAANEHLRRAKIDEQYKITI
jgi:protein gp37